MDLPEFLEIIKSPGITKKTFLTANFGCRVNAAEINLLSQILVDSGFVPTSTDPGIILVNTCSVTKKGEKESLGKARSYHLQYPDAAILVTGCARLKKLSGIPNIFLFDNSDKEKIIADLNCAYTPKILDKFSHTHRYLLKIQSGCTQFCSYCTVPYQRQYLWSLPIDKAVGTVQKIIGEGYKEIIITGVNLDQYTYSFSDLLESLLVSTKIDLISFGSVPVNCIDQKFLELYKRFPTRLSHFLHVPIQSGSDRILELMKRPYDRKKILDAVTGLKKTIGDVNLGTDVIVGFPGESAEDFQETLELCQNIGFSKIHTFRFSPRPNTLARFYFDKYPKISKEEISQRSRSVRSLTK